MELLYLIGGLVLGSIAGAVITRICLDGKVQEWSLSPADLQTHFDANLRHLVDRVDALGSLTTLNPASGSSALHSMHTILIELQRSGQGLGPYALTRHFTHLQAQLDNLTELISQRPVHTNGAKRGRKTNAEKAALLQRQQTQEE